MRYGLIAFFLVRAVAIPVQSDAQIFGLSERQEIELGREAAKKVESDLPILKDREITDYVDEVGQKLVRRSQQNNIRYSFKVVNSPEINAFALPGGFIYVNRGLRLTCFLRQSWTGGYLSLIDGFESVSKVPLPSSRTAI